MYCFCHCFLYARTEAYCRRELCGNFTPKVSVSWLIMSVSWFLAKWVKWALAYEHARASNHRPTAYSRRPNILISSIDCLAYTGAQSYCLRAIKHEVSYMFLRQRSDTRDPVYKWWTWLAFFCMMQICPTALVSMLRNNETITQRWAETCWAKSYGANENLIQTNRLKRGKTHATKSWLVLG